MICSPRWSCSRAACEGAAVSDANLLNGVIAIKVGNVSKKVGPPRWRCLRYKRPWWNRPNWLFEVRVLSCWRLELYYYDCYGVISSLVKIMDIPMAKYVTLAAHDVGAVVQPRSSVSCGVHVHHDLWLVNQAHVHSCPGSTCCSATKQYTASWKKPEFLVKSLGGYWPSFLIIGSFHTVLCW